MYKIKTGIAVFFAIFFTISLNQAGFAASNFENTNVLSSAINDGEGFIKRMQELTERAETLKKEVAQLDQIEIKDAALVKMRATLKEELLPFVDYLLSEASHIIVSAQEEDFKDALQICNREIKSLKNLYDTIKEEFSKMEPIKLCVAKSYSQCLEIMINLFELNRDEMHAKWIGESSDKNALDRNKKITFNPDEEKELLDKLLELGKIKYEVDEDYNNLDNFGKTVIKETLSLAEVTVSEMRQNVGYNIDGLKRLTESMVLPNESLSKTRDFYMSEDDGVPKEFCKVMVKICDIHIRLIAICSKAINRAIMELGLKDEL